MKKSFRVAIIVGVAAIVVGVPLHLRSTWSGKGLATWREEVKLLDGQVITIQQSRECQTLGPDKKDWVCRSATIDFLPPGIRPWSFVNGWRGPVQPLVVNVWEGHLFLVGIFPTAVEYINDGAPVHPYISYEYIQGSWRRIDFSATPTQIFDCNLLIGQLPPNDSASVSLALKAAEHVDPSMQRISPTLGLF